MKINCISCGHQINVDDETYARYHGPLRCWVCHAVLAVRIADGCVESVALPAVTDSLPSAVSAVAKPATKTKPLVQEVSHD